MSGFLCTMVGSTFGVAAVAEVIRSKKGITAVGNAQVDTAQSKFGGASALFDGTSDYLQVGDSSDFAWGTGAFTVEFWVRHNVINDQQVYCDFRSSSTNHFIFYVKADNKLEYYDGSTYTSTVNMAANTWYHLAVVRSGTSLKIYRDGVEVISATNSANHTSQKCIIASSQEGFSTNSVNGWIDEFRVSNTARYTANFTPSTTPFVNDANTLLLLHMDGTDAITYFEDDNGIRQQVGLSAFNQCQISTAQSKFGGSSISFDGSDDYVALSNMPSTASSDYTFEFWGYFSILPWNQTLGGGSYMMAATKSSGDYILIGRSGTGSQVNIQIATGNKYGSFTKSGVNLAINTWYHIAIVRSSGVFKVFFNGSELTTFNNDSGFTNSGRTEDMSFSSLGKFTDSRGSWQGYMDEIRVSKSARYSADFTPSTTPFVNDANTILLMHGDGTNASTVLRDDNGVRSQIGITAVGNAQIDTAQSKFGGSSALFDGTGDYLDSNTTIITLGTSDFTIEGWVRASTTMANNGIFHLSPTGFSISGNAVNRGLAFAFYNTSTYGWVQYAGNADWGAGVGTAHSANTWYHFAMVRSGSTLTTYINGTSQLSVTDSTNYTAHRLIVGGYYSSSFLMNGHVDEFRISNTARYTANFTAPTSPFQNDANTLLLLHMDGTDTSTVFVDDNGVTPTHTYS